LPHRTISTNVEIWPQITRKKEADLYIASSPPSFIEGKKALLARRNAFAVRAKGAV
jgi:hypothetical protein